MTTIEWTEKSWNPIIGCSVVWTGKLALAPERVLAAPVHRKKPTTWFVNSMGDLFHEDVPDEWIDRVFAVMALCPQHRFQVLTKRPGRAHDYIDGLSLVGGEAARANAIRRQMQAGDGWIHRVAWPLPNVWLGVSAEDQSRADERIPHLLATPAAVRFVSAEPLLGPVRLDQVVNQLNDAEGQPWLEALRGYAWDDDGDSCPTGKRLDWVIAGGESGPSARPMHPDWARSLRNQCQAAGVAFFFKQWGTYAPYDFESATHHDWMILDTGGGLDLPDYRLPDEWAGEVGVRKVGKARAGRLLDGREWNEMPEADNA